MDYSPPGSSVHGISQVRIMEGVAFSSLGDLPDSGIKPMSLGLAGGCFTTEAPEPKTYIVFLKIKLINKSIKFW